MDILEVKFVVDIPGGLHGGQEADRVLGPGPLIQVQQGIAGQIEAGGQH